MQKPNTQLTDILFNLIKSVKGISERDFNYNGFRSRISELREHLLIKETLISFKNRFGNSGQYKKHWITNTEKAKAVKLYKSLFS
jgi:hypothetical protein